MAIKSDNGYIYFNEMLYRCMKRKYGNMKINKKMQIFELRTQYSIYFMTKNAQNIKSYGMSNDDIFNSLVKKENGVNPFLTIMNFKISFKTWLKRAREEIHGKDEQILTPFGDKKIVAVEIEVEEEVEITSDEEDLTQSVYGLSRKQSMFSRNFPNSAELSKESWNNMSKKKKDPLAKFKKKMDSKVKSHKLTQSALKDLVEQKKLTGLSKSALSTPGSKDEIIGENGIGASKKHDGGKNKSSKS